MGPVRGVFSDTNALFYCTETCAGTLLLCPWHRYMRNSHSDQVSASKSILMHFSWDFSFFWVFLHIRRVKNWWKRLVTIIRKWVWQLIFVHNTRLLLRKLVEKTACRKLFSLNPHVQKLLKNRDFDFSSKMSWKTWKNDLQTWLSELEGSYLVSKRPTVFLNTCKNGNLKTCFSRDFQSKNHFFRNFILLLDISKNFQKKSQFRTHSPPSQPQSGLTIGRVWESVCVRECVC